MIPAGRILKRIQAAAKIENDSTLTERAWDIMRDEYWDLCRRVSWQPLRKRVTIDTTSSAYSSGMWMPSDMFGIDMVIDSNDVPYIERDRAGIEADEYGYRYYTYRASTTPLTGDFDVNIETSDEGISSFTSTTLDTYVALGNSVDGEYIRFGEEPGYYLIGSDTSPYSITPKYYGPAMHDERYEVRPSETQKIVFIDPSDNEIETLDTVYVHYWTAPEQIYALWQNILLPTAKILMLRTLREMPEAKERRPVSDKEEEKAMGDALRLNPSFPRRPDPRDKHNGLFEFKNHLYKDR